MTARDSLFPLRSELRTREQMEWIHGRFKLDGLERLARSTRDYYDSHGNYLPDVAALAHAAIKEAERLSEQIALLRAEREAGPQTQRCPDPGCSVQTCGPGYSACPRCGGDLVAA